VAAAVAAAVHRLEDVEQQQQLLEVIDGQAIVDVIERMRARMNDSLGVEVGSQLDDVASKRLDLLKLGLRDGPAEDVDPAAIIRKVSGDLVADEGSGQMRDLEGAADAVVIGNGDELHAAALGGRVDSVR